MCMRIFIYAYTYIHAELYNFAYICIYTHTHTQIYMYAKSLQLFLTLCDPMDCSPPSCSVHGILQARILEWVAIFFSYKYIFEISQDLSGYVCLQ